MKPPLAAGFSSPPEHPAGRRDLPATGNPVLDAGIAMGASELQLIEGHSPSYSAFGTFQAGTGGELGREQIENAAAAARTAGEVLKFGQISDQSLRRRLNQAAPSLQVAFQVKVLRTKPRMEVDIRFLYGRSDDTGPEGGSRAPIRRKPPSPRPARPQPPEEPPLNP